MSQHVTVHLSAEQRQHLENLIRKGNAPARVQTRARILLLSDHLSDHRPAHQANPGQERTPLTPLTQKQVAQATLTSAPTVCQICRRFALDGIEAALSEKPRPGAVPKITGEVEAQLCLLACSDPPTGQARWTLRLLADKLIELGYVASITEAALCKRLKKTRLSPGKSRPGASAPPPPAS
jgi:Homeodomain-like domain